MTNDSFTVLTWICVVVFAVTCLITILGMLGIVEVGPRNRYLNRLVNILIFQLVIGIVANVVAQYGRSPRTGGSSQPKSNQVVTPVATNQTTPKIPAASEIPKNGERSDIETITSVAKRLVTLDDKLDFKERPGGTGMGPKKPGVIHTSGDDNDSGWICLKIPPEAKEFKADLGNYTNGGGGNWIASAMVGPNESDLKPVRLNLATTKKEFNARNKGDRIPVRIEFTADDAILKLIAETKGSAAGVDTEWRDAVWIFGQRAPKMEIKGPE